jgi:hypothetical protein
MFLLQGSKQVCDLRFRGIEAAVQERKAKIMAGA